MREGRRDLAVFALEGGFKAMQNHPHIDMKKIISVDLFIYV